MAVIKSIICRSFCLCFLCCTQYTIAQTSHATVRGYVTADSVNSKTDTVFIYLLDVTNDKIITVIRQPHGEFEFMLPSKAPAKIVIVSSEFQRVETQPFSVSCDTCATILDTIYLRRKIVSLEEVKVVSKKKLIIEDIDKTTYNVEDDPDAEHFPLLEILRKVPLVNISESNSIDINGEMILVLVNGKRSGLFKRNVGEIMKNFPAKLVKSVEIITNPSAKYDAEGVGAIINVVLSKRKFDGYNASLGTNFNTLRSASAVGLLTAKLKKFGYNAYYAPVISHFPKRKVKQQIAYFSPYDFSSIQQTGVRNLYKNISFNNELFFELDSLNLLSIDFSNSTSNRNSALWDHSYILNALSQIQEDFDIETAQSGKYNNPTVSFSYQKSFKEYPSRLLSFLYLFDWNRYKESNIQKVTGIINYPSGVNYSRNIEREKEHTFQIDYNQILWKNEFETGAKAIYRNNASNYYFNLFNLQGLDVPEDGEYIFSQSVYSVYLTYAIRFKVISFRIGYRGEFTYNEINDSLKKQYFSSIPTLSLSMKVGKKSVLKFAYTKRIERPGLSYLNPYIDITNNKFITVGNPDLDVEKTNNFEFAYNAAFKNLTIRSTINFHSGRNTIEPFIWVLPDSVSRRSYYNIGRTKLLAYNQFLSHKISSSLNQILKINFYYREFWMFNALSNSGWASSVDYTLNYRNEKFWRAALNVSYVSSSPSLQGNMQGRVTNYLLIGKEFLNRKLYIGCTVRNLFPAHLNIKSNFSSNNFYQQNISSVLQRAFQININYSFGQLKERISRPDKSIENNDQKKIDKKEKPAIL